MANQKLAFSCGRFQHYWFICRVAVCRGVCACQRRGGGGGEQKWDRTLLLGNPSLIAQVVLNTFRCDRFWLPMTSRPTSCWALAQSTPLIQCVSIYRSFVVIQGFQVCASWKQSQQISCWSSPAAQLIKLGSLELCELCLCSDIANMYS